MDLNRLRTFLVVAETGNITRAAERLFRTQPAITQQMKLFQEELDLVLFEKKMARIFLTAQGKALYESAKPHMRELEDLPLRLRNDKANVSGMIRMGATPEVGPLIAPGLFASFKRDYPKVLFQLKLLDIHAIAKALLTSDLDFGLTTEPKNDFHLESFDFVGGARTPIVSELYINQKPLVESAQDLLSLAILKLKSPLADWEPWLEVNAPPLKDQWQAIEPIAEVGDLLSLQEMVVRGMGIGMGFLPLIEPQLEMGHIQPLFPAIPPLHFKVYLTRRKTRNPHWSHDLFEDFVRTNGTNMGKKCWDFQA